MSLHQTDRTPASRPVLHMTAGIAPGGCGRVVRATVLFAVLLCGATGAARAEVCNARFFHNGGAIEIVGSGVVTVSAKLDFSKVSKTSAEVCQAQVNGNASYALMGFLGGSTDVDHLMRVNGLTTSLTKSDAGPGPDAASLDLRMFSLFGYGVPIRSVGQRLPAQAFKILLGPADKPTTPMVVRTGEKTVGTRQAIQTALGQQSCWPVRYDRNTDPTMANIRGVTLPVPAIQSRVTDWFCPTVNLVMKQEIEQSGQRAVIEVTSVK